MHRKYLVYIQPIIWHINLLKRALYGLYTAYNSFHNFFGQLLRDIVFTPYRADQDFWLRKSYEYDGYYYIYTHVDDIIITENKPFKYMNEIIQHFKGRDITYSPD